MSAFLLRLAARSAWNRRFTLALTVCSIALATLMLLGVERIRTDLHESFRSAVSGTDLVVGARTGSVNLLLYSVFRVGAATNDIRWSSIQALEQLRGVEWVVPLSLGDSHRGFPVVGTTPNYFDHFRYGARQPLRLAHGAVFAELFDAVIGAEVADRLGYRLGQRITLAHGSGEIELADHADKPFEITGILAATGTPVDRTVHISLQAMTALHADWIGGVPPSGRRAAAPSPPVRNLQPKAVTAALVGLQSRAAVFSVQREINRFDGEPLMAILPGVALDELWQVIGTGEKGLLLMSGLVAGVSVAGLISVVLAGLNERRRELAVLRAVGANPYHLMLLLALEGLLVAASGIVLGVAVMVAALAIAGPWLQSAYGLTVHAFAPTATQLAYLAGLAVAGLLASLLPGWLAYRLSLSDGLMPRT
ncbi:MAG: ABC transporter permease [Lautropia sp.]